MSEIPSAKSQKKITHGVFAPWVFLISFQIVNHHFDLQQ